MGGEVQPLAEWRGEELALASGRSLPWLPLLGEDGYIVRDLSTLVAAYPKAGKTTLVLALIGEWLAQGETVVLFTEEPQQIWEHRLTSPPERWKGLTIIPGLSADPDAMYERAFHGPEVIVVLDTVRNLLQFDDETDNSAIARVVGPWIAAARAAGKTLLGLHHTTKAGGEHGRGIAGGHALLAIFDTAIEMSRVRGIDNRRELKVLSRLITPEDLLIERTAEGELRVLGSAAAVERDDVGERVAELLDAEWRPTRQLRELLEEPRPSLNTVRSALNDLAAEGRAERDPAEDRSGAKYRFRAPQPHLPQALSKVGGEVSETESTPQEEHDDAVGVVLRAFPGSEVEDAS